ncbi:hypothetical protein Tco_0403649 [Tanacetum coccineum]
MLRCTYLKVQPFGLAKLTIYILMCKAYGFEPTLNVLRVFLSLGPGSDWLTLSIRGEANVPYLFIKPFTNILAWKGKFFYIQYTIVLEQYPTFSDEADQLDKQSFKDPLPYTIRRDPLYQRLARHPVDVQTFPEPIVYMAGIFDRWMSLLWSLDGIRNFVATGNDKDLRFITKNPHEGIFGVGSPTVSVNNDLVEALPVQSVASAHPSHLVEIYI